MKRKIVVVSVVLWFICAFGGGLWGRFEQYLRTRSIPPGQLEVQNLRDLYNAKLFDDVLAECDRDEQNVEFADFRPEMMYVRWAADRKTGRTEAADRVRRDFFDRFPDHPLAADLHFSNALDRLASADYAGADAELSIIRERYPSSGVSVKAGELLKRLATASTTTAAAQ